MARLLPDSLEGRIFLLVAGLMAAAAAGALALVWNTHGQGLSRQQAQNISHTLEMASLLVRNLHEDASNRNFETIMQQRGELQRSLAAFLAVMKAEHAREKAGLASRDQAQQQVLEIARQISAPSGINIFLFDSRLRGLVHADKSLIGLDWSGLKGTTGDNALENAVPLVKRDGSDTLVLWWPKGAGGVAARHLARIGAFPEWEWYVGASVDYGRIDTRVLQERNHMMNDALESLSRMRLGATGRLFVMEGHGPAFLLTPPGIWRNDMAAAMEQAQEALPGAPQRITLPGSRDVQEVHTLYIPEMGWRIGLIISERELSEGANALAAQILATLAGLAAAGLALAWALARQVTKPVRALAASASGITFSQGAGPETVRAVRELAAATPGDIGVLASSWANALEELDNVMAGLREASRESALSATELAQSKKELEHLNAELESRVRLRTAALEAVNHRLRASEERYRGLFRDSPIAYAEFDLSELAAFMRSRDIVQAQDVEALLEGDPGFAQACMRLIRLSDANPAAVELAGARSKAELAAALERIAQPDGLPAFLEMLAAFQSGETAQTGQLPIQRLSGERLATMASMRPLPGHEQSLGRVVASFQDITAITLVQDRLLAANEQALAASRTKSEFLANMSHELRTPLSAILGLAELSGRDPDPAKAPGRLEMIAESARTLLDIIGDVLDLSRVESGRMVLENVAFDPRRVVGKALEPVRARCEEKGLELTLELSENLPASLMGDPVRLGQVVSNLVVNAAKFTQAGFVRVTAGEEERSGERFTLRVCVEDSGPGIDPSQTEAIFESFRQADLSYSKKHQGVGLGLAICRELTSLMGGRVWVESGPGSGSRFVFTAVFGLEPGLCAARQTPVAPGAPVLAESVPAGSATTPKRWPRDMPPPAEQADALAPGLVLVVEDNPVNSHVFIEYLALLGYRTLTAPDGVQALELLAANHVDFVFLDVQMPRMDGLEAVRRIRAGECGRRAAGLPVVAMTAYALTGDRERFLEAGMTDYLPKPVSMDAIRDVLARFLPPPGQSRQDPSRKALGPLLAEFVGYVRKRTDDAGELLRMGNLVEAAKAAHDVKGSSMAFGVDRVNRAGARLEAAIRAGGGPETAEVLAEVYTALAELEAPDPASPLSMA